MSVRTTDPKTVTHVTLNLEFVRHNARTLRSLAPDSKLMAVIKANGYGHGILRMAKALAPYVDALAVARTDSGLELRAGGIEQRIVVLQGFANAAEVQLHQANRLEPVIHSPWQIEVLSGLSPDTSFPIWLKLDSGMHRLGLLPDEFLSGLERLSEMSHIPSPIPLMTHFANADDLQDDYTLQQWAEFQTLAPVQHPQCAANSAAILAWPTTHADWIRPGLSLYGVSPFQGRTGPEEGLKPVMTLKTHIISIKNVSKGARIGYGGTYRCETPQRIGVIAAGYADGYPRALPTGTPVIIHGQRVPTVGRVSMDMTMVDLTHCTQAQVGDEVILWGEGLPVEEIAERAGTIPYTLLTGVTPRVRIVELGAD